MTCDTGAPYFDLANEKCKWTCPPTGYCKSNIPYDTTAAALAAGSTAVGSTTTAPVDTCWKS